MESRPSENAKKRTQKKTPKDGGFPETTTCLRRMFDVPSTCLRRVFNPSWRDG
jgi:hypothetical protein